MNVVELIVFVLIVVFHDDSNGLLFIQFAYIVIVSHDTSFLLYVVFAFEWANWLSICACCWLSRPLSS